MTKDINDYKPTFECGTCGYQDFLGNTEVCPVCEPEKAEEQDLCYFVNSTESMCRQDGEHCPHIPDRSWENCPKLMAYNPRLGKK
jgi:hypothetical protein